MWFRIELDNTGAILSCVEVELAERQNRFVRFVEAPDKAGACTSVKDWYAARCRKMVLAKQEKTARRHSEGRCTECETPAAPGGKMCARHIELRRSYGKEKRRREREGIAPPLRGNAQLTYLVAHEPQLRASRVLYEFDKRGPEGFRVWLVELLRDRLSGLKVA